MKVFILLVGLLLGINIGVSAKNACSCEDAIGIAQRIDIKLVAKDFKAVRQLINQLPQTSNSYKLIYAYQNLRLAFEEDNLSTIEADLASAIALGKSSSCSCTYLDVLKLASNYYGKKANYPKLLKTDIEILNLLENQKDNFGIANSLLNIASTLNRLNNPRKGIIYTQRAVALTRKLPDSLKKASILNKITASYLWYGQDFKSTKHLDSASYFAKYAIKVAQQYHAVMPQISAIIRLNAIAQEQNRYADAIMYLNQATALCNPQSDIAQLASIYSDKANVYKVLKNYNKAIAYADSSLEYNKKLNYPPLVANIYHGIYEIEQLRGNYKASLMAYQQEKLITDSLSNIDKNRQVLELEQKYNKVRNEKIIHDLSQEKRINQLQLRLLGVGIVLIAILVLFLLFIYRQSLLKQQHKLLSAEQRLNRSRINPHFFFNALTTLQGMALTPHDGKNLAIQIASFSKIMRQILESTYTEYFSLHNEIVFLEEYLNLRMLNDPGRFSYEIKLNNIDDDNDFLVPVMILQPFIENAIEHGFAGIQYKGVITVNFEVEFGELLILVTDNGKGFESKVSGTKSRAMEIITDRLLLINKEHKSNARFAIESTINGTSVKLFLPLIKNNESFDN